MYQAEKFRGSKYFFHIVLNIDKIVKRYAMKSNITFIVEWY